MWVVFFIGQGFCELDLFSVTKNISITKLTRKSCRSILWVCIPNRLDAADVVYSAERKAIETAEIIAAKLSVAVEVREAMHENDRSATGFLQSEEFEAVATQFFANPLVSIRGWERAIDAQSRIVREVESVMARDQPGDVLFVGHGGVGTLLFCHCSGLAIDRAHDQPAGGGNYFAFTREGRRVLHPWRPMEYKERA